MGLSVVGLRVDVGKLVGRSVDGEFVGSSDGFDDVGRKDGFMVGKENIGEVDGLDVPGCRDGLLDGRLVVGLVVKGFTVG